ncbi:carbohydrate sulfotransferase 4-like [Ruditapes philippinarum]|uniref:carbohydrate sulfotransferase 4-like n=1 Tax=Ruditapes philippinarum TaxID=129788 RepID=UPI00295BC0A9|nr:carbohydrate sulfotransferase 4-like [Ruditapes philippinarum]
MLHVLSSVLNCSLVSLLNVVQDRVHDHGGYSGPSWNKYRACVAGFNAKSECLRQLEEICRNKTHRVLKVLRLSFSSFQPLMEINPKLKIVHLVRDPRAIIHSRLYSRFYPVERPRKNDSLEKNLCEKMLEDIKDVIKLKINYPDRVIVLYYEDIIENMDIRLKQIYKKLNLTYNKEGVETFSKINVNLSPPEMGSSFTKDRKHDNAFWWRKYITWEEVQRIDNWCGELYSILGYKTLRRNEIRDDSVPSYKVSPSFKIQ